MSERTVEQEENITAFFQLRIRFTLQNYPSFRARYFFGCLIKQHFDNKYLENIQQSSVYLLIIQYLGGYILIQSVNARSNLICSVLNIFDIYINLFLGQPIILHPLFFFIHPFSLLSFFSITFFCFFSIFSSFSLPSGSFCLTSFGLAHSRGSFETIDKIWHCSAVQ